MVLFSPSNTFNHKIKSLEMVADIADDVEENTYLFLVHILANNIICKIKTELERPL